MKDVFLIVLLLSSFSISKEYWQKISAPESGGYFGSGNRLVVSPDDEIYLVADTGAYVSSDEGLNWSILELNVRGTISLSDEGTIYLGKNDNFVIRSKDKGQTWDTLITPLGYGAFSVLETEDNSVLMGSFTADGIFKTQDLGKSFSMVFGDSIHSFSNWNFLVKNKLGKIFGMQQSSKEIHISSDNGNSWTSLEIPREIGNDVFISFFQSNNRGAFVITKRGHILRVEDDDSALKLYATLKTNENIYATNVCIRKDGTLFVNSVGSIWMSTDRGITWINQKSGLSDPAMLPGNMSIIDMKVNSKGFVYLYGPSGLYKSREGNAIVNMLSRTSLSASPQFMNIYTVLGKKIKSLDGMHTNWDRTDSRGKIVNQGIYYGVSVFEDGVVETDKLNLTE